MPLYTWLRPRTGDDVETLKTKRRAAQKIKALRAALEAHIDTADLPQDVQPPSDASRYVRIATWNLREFDSSSYGYRSQEAKAYIAEILSYFDLRVYADSCGLILAFLGNGGRNAATIFSLR